MPPLLEILLQQFELGNKRNAVFVFCSPPCPNSRTPEHKRLANTANTVNTVGGKYRELSISRGVAMTYVGVDERACRPDRRAMALMHATSNVAGAVTGVFEFRVYR